MFEEWNQVFPSVGCLVTMIDRLTHTSEILTIEGESYRVKEAQERKAQKKAKRASKKPKRT